MGKLAAETENLDLIFAALADRTRRAILSRLARGELSVSEIAEPFEITAPAITKHLKVLQRAGLITQSRSAQWRPCRLEAAPLKIAAEWVGNYRQLWEERFDRLDEYLHEVQAKGKKKSNKSEKKRKAKKRRKL